MSDSERGFTIVELLIATTVLSMILLLTTVMMTRIGGQYYKGVNVARMQTTSRDVVAQVTADIQGSNTNSPIVTTSVTTSPYEEDYTCVGNARYTYVVGVEIGTHGYYHGLVRDTPSSCTSPIPNLKSPAPLTNAVELLPANTRVINFNVGAGGSSVPASVDVRVGYGDDTVFCTAGTPSTCTSGTPMTIADYNNGDLQCKGGAGDQFCATAYLATDVVQRITK